MKNELCIGQKKVADKSNEITAIPEIINSLDIENAVVSIDATGCQKEIISLIIEKKGHYFWHLDVIFREDMCRARAGVSAENLSVLRKLALQMIKNQKDKLSLKKQRFKAAYNTDYLKDTI